LVWGADSSGRYRARDYFEALETGDQAKFEPLFHRLAETGKISNRERFVKEPNGIYCFKCHARRIACFFDERDVVLIHGFGKKTTSSKRSRRQLATAAKLRAQYLEENRRRCTR
jgi:phage-related protein